MPGSILTPAQRAAFHQDGYVLVRGLFDTEEIALMRGAIEQDPAISANFYDRKDGGGMATKIALWNHPGDSAYGLAARSQRLAVTLEDLLGGEVFNYHSMLTA